MGPQSEPALDGATLKVAELFDSLQGEGPTAGAPCTFLRLALCNLACRWCDTPYTWDWSRHRPEDEVRRLPVEGVAARLAAARGGRVVITGGEPLLQRAALEALLARLPGVTVEVETNGTLEPGARLAGRVDQWNVSPKLAHSGEPPERRWRKEALAALAGTGRAWWKLVLRGPEDREEARRLADDAALPPERVLVMPLAATPEELSERGPRVAAVALAEGWRYSPRLHVELWRGARGR